MDSNIKKFFKIIPVAACVLVTGCQRGVVITVQQQNGIVTFITTRDGSDEVACVDDIAVYPATPESAEAIWSPLADHPKNCTDRFVYGQNPPHFTTSGRPPALVKGVQYRVFASGPGLIGSNRFTYEGPN